MRMREVGVLGSQDLGSRSPSNVVTAGPWTSRDSYVAETAVAIDRLVAKVERLERREEALNARVAELAEHAQQASRLQSLAESLRNSRDYKVGELARQIKDLRGRLDVFEGPKTVFAGLAFKTLADIDRRLAELTAADIKAEAAQRHLKAAQLVIGFLTAAVLGLGARVFL
jgi:phage shock protein A